jgi:hypothetical protein
MQTGSIESVIANQHRTGTPVDFYHFHPYMKRPSTARVPTAGELKDIFSGGGKCQPGQSEQAGR